jgi:outer membrane protein OmpA-like peptidoglycan-associated protein
MKKLLLSMAVVAFSAQAAFAQSALVESKTTDNWYVGVAAGASVKTTHTAIMKNLNPTAGIRIGRNWTPVVGWAVEGLAFFNDKKFYDVSTFVKATNVNALGILNLSNWFGGYQGQPRFFEVGAVAGFGWQHIFGVPKGVDKNMLTSKLGLDLMFNLGSKKAWQLYLEPSINYDLDGDWRDGFTNTPNNRNKFDINASALQLLVGLNYKFGNSNGSHNFVKGQFRDQAEIDALNANINELRSAADAKDRQLDANAKTIAQLRAELEACKNKPATVEKDCDINLNPVVLFTCGSSRIQANQTINVEQIAKYMKENPNARVLINGYASPEGSVKLNQRLSESRAAAVKDMLVKKYGISADRLDVKGNGPTNKIFDKVQFNRVATFQSK